MKAENVAAASHSHSVTHNDRIANANAMKKQGPQTLRMTKTQTIRNQLHRISRIDHHVTETLEFSDQGST
ncbi:MAG: hypothetical protein L7U72_10710 [Rubripirellula sp.]|nr:hypothetical protein [Rubripirellula sp.]